MVTSVGPSSSREFDFPLFRVEEEDSHVTLTPLDNPFPQTQAKTTTEKGAGTFTLDLNKQAPLTPVQEEDVADILKKILRDLPINVGRISRDLIEDAALQPHKNLIFPALITRLCATFAVPEYPTDRVFYSTSQIDQGTIRRMLIRRPEFGAQVADIPPAKTRTRRSRRTRPTTARPPTPPRPRTKMASDRPGPSQPAEEPDEDDMPWQQALKNHMATQTTMLTDLTKTVTKLQEEFTSFSGRLRQIEELFGLVDDGNDGILPEEDDLADSEDDLDDDPASDTP